MGEIISKKTSFKKKRFINTVINLYKGGKSVAFIHEQTGLARLTIYKWLHECEADGTLANAAGMTIPVEDNSSGVLTCAALPSFTATIVPTDQLTIGNPGLVFNLQPSTSSSISLGETKAEEANVAGKKEVSDKAEQENLKDVYAFDEKEYEGKSQEELIGVIRDLHRKLGDKTVEAKAYSTMIDVAEETLHIDIRKKPAARQ